MKFALPPATRQSCARLIRKAVSIAGLMVLPLSVTVVALIVGEFVVRQVDGYELRAWRLTREAPVAVPAPVSAPGGANVAEQYLDTIPRAEGMKREWFALSPAALPHSPVDPVLAEASQRFTAANPGGCVDCIFNWEYASHDLCHGDPILDKLPGFMFVFDAPNDSDRPRYRFPRNAILASGLVTNQFGFRGGPIELRKPDRTIRLAFVGSSTTVNAHGYPFSYPEMVGYWLNLWAQNSGLDVKVEAINAGRSGIDVEDEAVIFRDEVAPLEPDFVLFDGDYNSFSAAGIVEQPRGIAKRVQAVRAWLDEHSAIGRRLISGTRSLMVQNGEEPHKPAYRVRWPQGVDEEDPPLDNRELPAGLSSVVRTLDSVRENANRVGGQLVLTSLFLFAFDGLKLDPVANKGLYDYLNVLLYPYHYSELERTARFVNRVYGKYARVHELPFLDYNGLVPHDPALYGDAIHATYDGTRLRAWIVAQQMAPLLRERIAAGLLPRPTQSELTRHPAFPGNERSVSFDCSQATASDKRLETIRLNRAAPEISAAKLEVGDTLQVKIGPDTVANDYLASVPTTGSPYPEKDLLLIMDLQTHVGEVRIGILSKDRNRFLAYRDVPASTKHITIRVPFVSENGMVGPIVISKVSPAGQAASAEINSASIWSRALDARVFNEYAKGFALPPAQ